MPSSATPIASDAREPAGRRRTGRARPPRRALPTPPAGATRRLPDDRERRPTHPRSRGPGRATAAVAYARRTRRADRYGTRSCPALCRGAGAPGPRPGAGRSGCGRASSRCPTG
ncbi:MAG: hypothetical protein B7733_08255 [Myxococcales bacterium FL481]|nr:MAG: hypothetical protein B7733_08255 [Myxococcales bacterium FL481]